MPCITDYIVSMTEDYAEPETFIITSRTLEKYQMIPMGVERALNQPPQLR